MHFQRQTAFELMRWGRHRAARLGAVQPAERLATGPAVPTMEIDGVKYREAPETSYCNGCAFSGGVLSCRLSGGWEDDNPNSVRAFGGGCMNRRVIYIKAE